jgi:hypothetical protein
MRRACTADAHLLGPEDHGYHALGLGGLRALVDEDGAELHLGQPRVTGAHARAADDICVLGVGRVQRRQDT